MMKLNYFGGRSRLAKKMAALGAKNSGGSSGGFISGGATGLLGATPTVAQQPVAVGQAVATPRVVSPWLGNVVSAPIQVAQTAAAQQAQTAAMQQTQANQAIQNATPVQTAPVQNAQQPVQQQPVAAPTYNNTGATQNNTGVVAQSTPTKPGTK